MPGRTAAPVRIGILGASRWVPMTLLGPAKENAEVVVAAVASRDASRARAFAAKHGIDRVHGDYAALIADPELDAAADKRARQVDSGRARRGQACAVPKADRAVMEALQYRYHPLTARVGQIIASGELGNLQRVEIAICVLLPKRSNANAYVRPHNNQ